MLCRPDSVLCVSWLTYLWLSKVSAIGRELLQGMPLCGYSVEPSDSIVPCGYKLQNINIIWIAIYKEHKWEKKKR